MWKDYANLPRSIHILCLGSFVNRAGTFVVIFLTLYLKTELELGVTFATRAMGLFGLGAIIAALVGGHLADKIGRRTVMLASLFGGAAILMVFSFVRTPSVVMLMVLLFSLVAEMYRPAAAAMIADLVAPRQRPHAFGLMYVSINLGFAVGAYVGGIIAEYDFHWLFWGDALTSSIYGLIIVATIRESMPSRHPSVRLAEDQPVAQAAKDGSTLSNPLDDASTSDPAGIQPITDAHATDARAGIPSPAPSRREFPAAESGEIPLGAAAKHIITHYPFVIYCLATFLLALVFMQALSTFPLYLEHLGFTAKDYGSKVIFLNGLLIVCLQLPLTSFLKRFDRGTIVVAGAVVQAVGFGLIGLAATLWQFALTVVVWTMGEMMMAPFSFAIVSDFAPTPLRARYMGVFNMSFSSSMMLGAPIGGEVLGHPRLGGPYLWAGSFLVAMVATLLYFSVRRHVGGKTE
ncbi:MAG: MFS transporter [Phycisphaerae bacterium]|nr:MFS transporter [Phycisphaerae bacterium]